MPGINITIGANTAEFQKAITNLQQTVDQTAEKISDSFKTVNKTIKETKSRWEELAARTSAIRNSARIVQELGSWLRTPLEQFSRFARINISTPSSQLSSIFTLFLLLSAAAFF